MATIKSFTDISQSRKLAEILPLKSADMAWYSSYAKDGYSIRMLNDTYPLHIIGDEHGEIPAWSLAALLSVLPNEVIIDNRFECHYQIDIRKHDGGDNITLYQIAYGNDRGLSGSWHDMINTGEKENLIDCCAQIIIKLHELNLL